MSERLRRSQNLVVPTHGERYDDANVAGMLGKDPIRLEVLSTLDLPF